MAYEPELGTWVRRGIYASMFARNMTDTHAMIAMCSTLVEEVEAAEGGGVAVMAVLRVGVLVLGVV